MVLAERTRKQLITGGNPDAIFEVPAEGLFVGDDDIEVAFIPAPTLKTIARRLIEHKLKFIQNLDITYLWKAQGGKKGGHVVFGKTVKPSGLADYALQCDLVIWVAADHVRDHRFTAYQIEALLYHELLHCGVSDKGGPTIYPHDLEVFTAEIKEYGLWRPDLEEHRAIIQPRLWDAGNED